MQTLVALVAVHVRPHIPQFVALVCVLVSHPSSGSLLQSAKPVAQAMRHVPPTHEAVPLTLLQTSPHAPQLRASLVRFTHAPLQFVSGIGHAVVHTPLLQTWFAPHERPHMPQFDGSLRVSTHCPPAHTVSGKLQKHAPPTHAMPGSHFARHAPQLFGSLCVLTHWPLQNVWPAAHRHMPA